MDTNSPLSHARPVATEPIIGPGDDKRGYHSARYTTRNRDLQQRHTRAAAADLLSNALTPPLGLPKNVPVPDHNPLSAAKIALGRRLFFERRLSLNNTQSCAMCHIPEHGFAHNELATAVGFEGRTVRRNAPTLLNVAYQQRLFHDGRETTLEQQVWSPLLAANEMANPSIGAVVEKIKQLPGYLTQFKQAFDGRGPDMLTIGQALASYQRSLNAADSPFDRWYFAGESSALSDSAQRGFALFTGKAGCVGCHQMTEDAALLTDHQFHNTGIAWQRSMAKTPATQTVQLAPGVFVDVASELIESASAPAPNDLGRYEITLNPDDRWRIRTPTLRNIALTAPYMHNGALATLEAVIAFYNQGGYPNQWLDPRIRPLGLTAQNRMDLVAFLRALTGSTVIKLVADAFAAPIGDVGATKTIPENQ